MLSKYLHVLYITAKITHSEQNGVHALKLSVHGGSSTSQAWLELRVEWRGAHTQSGLSQRDWCSQDVGVAP